MLRGIALMKPGGRNARCKKIPFNRCLSLTHLSVGVPLSLSGLAPLPLQYRHLIPAPVDRTSARSWLSKHHWIAYKKMKPSTSMTHVACVSMPRSVVRSSVHSCPGKWVAIGCAVVYRARAAPAFSARIKCRHCTYDLASRPDQVMWECYQWLCLVDWSQGSTTINS